LSRRVHLPSSVQPEDLFRSANDAIAERGRELGWTLPGPFLCECSDIRCLARVVLPLEEYDELRSHRGRYALAPGHEIADATEIRRTKGFTLVEKLPRAARTA
jgi:hypothetical protein